MDAIAICVGIDFSVISIGANAVTLLSNDVEITPPSISNQFRYGTASSARKIKNSL